MDVVQKRTSNSNAMSAMLTGKYEVQVVHSTISALDVSTDDVHSSC